MPGRAISSSWVPRSATRPLSSTKILSACIRVVMRWEIRMVVALPIFSLSCWRILASVSASTADSESSKIITGAFWVSIRAMATRCFCPPERVTPRSPTTVS